MLKLIVMPTDERKDTKGEFIIQLNPRTFVQLEGLKIGNRVLIGKKHENRFFWASALLHKIDDTISENKIKMDQKLRTAVGVQQGDEVFIKKCNKIKKNIVKKILMSLLGTQSELLRVKKSTSVDMEIRVCRISKEVMKIIGIDEGDFIEIESINSSISLRALELTDNLRKNKMKAMGKDPKKYPDCSKILNIDPDLPWIFLDFDARRELRVEPCDAVKIYRNVEHRLYRKLNNLSIPIILAIVGAVIVLNISFISKIALLLIGLIIVFAFLVIEIKKEIS